MKFLCDRCKTRYSIGDDRVRGKILKIRCKNCANVITVREGMSDADPVDAGSVAAPRRHRATTAAPLVAQSSALAGNGHVVQAPGSALGAAFASAMTKPPPALEEEWYVSIDGEQAGPFTLADAQRWVANKSYDAELHCWSEGFDDWLPVDKVSHFRGLRKKPAPPPAMQAPPPLPRLGNSPSRPVAMVQAPQPIIPRDEETPKPLFAATMASLEKSVPAEPANGLPVMGSLQMRAPVTAPSATPPRGSGIISHGSVPNGSTANRVITRPGLGSKPAASAGFDSSEPASATTIEPAPFEDSGMTARPVEPSHAPFGSDGDDELDIGEVSRVVKLADISREPRRDPTGQIRRSGQMAAVGRQSMPVARVGTMSTPRIDQMVQGPGMADGMMMPLATPELAPVTAPTHRRGLFVLLGVALVLLLGVVGAVVYIVATNDSDDDQAHLDKVSDLNTERPPEITIKRPEMIAPGSGATQQTHPNTHPRTNPGNPGTHQTGSANVPDEPPGGQTALKSDEIEDMYGKHKFGAERCYMRAQKDPFIGDVKRIAVTLNIDQAGSVTDVSLDSHAQDTLGKCLASQVHSWKFRTSPGGTFRFTMAFAQ